MLPYYKIKRNSAICLYVQICKSKKWDIIAHFILYVSM
jgi:hypothetical protein